MKKLIKNVVMLDMTAATLESVEGLTVNNAVRVFVTASTRPLLGHIQFGNLVSIIEIPDGASASSINGSVTIDGNYESSLEGKQTYFMINGSLLIKNDVTPETLSRIFSAGGDINGSITLPDTLTALCPMLNIKVNGSINAYPSDSLLYTGDITVNNGFLSGLPENAKITAAKPGNVFIAPDTDPKLFSRHISELYVFGDTIVPSALCDVFYKAARLYEKVTVIPEGFVYSDKPLTINRAGIYTLKGKSLYTPHNIVFKDGFTENQINQLDFRLETEKAAIVPDCIVDAVFDRIKADGFYTYQGKLVTVNDEMNVNKLNHGETAVCSYLINQDALLSIPEDMTAEEIEQTIGEIFLYGDIALREAHVSAIKEKIVIEEGNLIIDDTSEDEAESDRNDDDDAASGYDIVIGNAVEFKL